MNLNVSELKGKSFDEKLKMWAEEVVPYCHSMAEKHNRAFFAFQSAPKKTNVLLLGLNPARRDPYESQKRTWEIPNGMTPEVFTKQNPFYKGGKYYNEKEKWNILEKFNVTLSASEKLRGLASNMVYMNILYFNSKDFSELKNRFPDWKEAYTKCIDYTKFLIQNIIKPKIIICLGIDNCFKQFIPKDNEVKNILQKYPNAVHKTTMNGITVYGIIHPSYAISNEFRKEIAIAIEKDLA